MLYNANHICLVVSTPLKNISHLGWWFPIYAKIQNVPNHQPDMMWCNTKPPHQFNPAWGKKDDCIYAEVTRFHGFTTRILLHQREFIPKSSMMLLSQWKYPYDPMIILVGGFWPPLWKIWYSQLWDDGINPILMGIFQKWQPNHQPVSYHIPLWDESHLPRMPRMLRPPASSLGRRLLRQHLPSRHPQFSKEQQLMGKVVNPKWTNKKHPSLPHWSMIWWFIWSGWWTWQFWQFTVYQLECMYP